jgi:hypothetical protein
MSGRSLLRWAGLAGLVSGILLVVTEIVLWVTTIGKPSSVASASSIFFVTMTLSLVAAYLAFLALVGLYVRQATQSGGPGLTSFVIASLGTALNLEHWGRVGWRVLCSCHSRIGARVSGCP